MILRGSTAAGEGAVSAPAGETSRSPLNRPRRICSALA